MINKTVQKSKQAGFTLVELIIVIVVITILAAAILVGINPALRFQQARNAQRWSEANAILNAVMSYKVDHGGALPTGFVALTPAILSTTEYTLGTNATGCDSPCASANAACIDLRTPIVGGGYLSDIPTDPNGGTAAETFYSVKSTATGGVLVTACSAENSEVISIQR
ncbi:MAG: prepilin-type N-terminal cleavage/methylation domain-containing protein [bacterium]